MQDEDLHRSPKDCSRLRGLEQKLQETTDKNTKLVKQIRGLRQQSMRQRKENIKLIKGRDSLMTEKIKMRKEITRLEQKLEKANQNRPNKNEKKVTFKENEIDDNDNAWETVGATKSKNSIKTRTAVNTCAKATPTKGQKVIENKNRKKQTRQKSTVKKSTKIDKRQPNKKDLDNQNVKNNEKNNRLSSSTECSSTTSNSNNSDLTQTINDLSDKDDNANVTRQIPFVKSKKKKCIIGDSNMRGLAKQLKPKLDNPDAVCVYKTSGMRIEHLIPRLKGYICEDTDAVVLHLGTNDISGSLNKVKEDINRLADKMKGFQNTHFYVAEIPPTKQNKYNAHIHHINCHIGEICAKLSNADYLPTPVKKQHLYRGGIHLNEEGQQILTSALNNHSINGQCFPIKTIITRT